MAEIPEKILQVFQEYRTYVLTTHTNPDGDGLGSEIALAAWLESRGKQVHIINTSPTPEMYRFLDPQGRMLLFSAENHAAVILNADVVVVVDTNHPDRLRSMKDVVLQSRAVKVCIDHHLEPNPFVQAAFTDDDATSTGELVYRLLLHLDRSPLSPEIAQALYCAIMTDTGSFRYPRVDAEIHRIVANLIEWGADPVAIYSEVYEQWSCGRIHLLGEMLAGLKTKCEGRLAYTVITQDMMQRTGTTHVDAENFTVYPMSVAGAVAGILFLEMTDGVKISFRSKGDIPINELAKEFHGNGHRNAAGAHLTGVKLGPVMTQVLSAAEKYVRSERANNSRSAAS